MKTKTIKAYYCDFCGKRMFSGGWMSRHEKRCTMNPDRVCGMGCIGVDIKSLIKKYSRGIEVIDNNSDFCEGWIEKVASWKKYARKFTIADIIDDCEGCPACSFAVLRLSGLNHRWMEPLIGKFDYKDIKDGWWAERNKEAERDDYYSGVYCR